MYSGIPVLALTASTINLLYSRDHLIVSLICRCIYTLRSCDHTCSLLTLSPIYTSTFYSSPIYFTHSPHALLHTNDDWNWKHSPRSQQWTPDSPLKSPILPKWRDGKTNTEILRIDLKQTISERSLTIHHTPKCRRVPVELLYSSLYQRILTDLGPANPLGHNPLSGSLHPYSITLEIQLAVSAPANKQTI